MKSSPYEFDVLLEFLSYRPSAAMPVLQRFAALDSAISHFDGGKNNFVYVPGTRDDRVVLVAHADTFWDAAYLQDLSDDFTEKKLQSKRHRPVLKRGVIRQRGWHKWGLGADDRAGCAMLWLLRESGHSLLITDGEEHGQIGAYHLRDHYPALSQELNAHRYMIQLDRRNNRDYKTYMLPVTDDFIRFIENNTGYTDAGRNSRTDIVALCTDICGVNFSIGYVNEHNPDEYLNVEGWLNTYHTIKVLLEKKQPCFPLL